MTIDERVAALPANGRELLADRLRRLGALRTEAEPAGGKRLLAYVAPRPGQSIDAAELRSFLRARLAEPMVPSALVVLARLPATASGKIDRLALPVPDEVQEVAPPAADRPRTPEERALAALWAEVLGLPSVGVDQDFFTLGGDSILLLRLCARARELGWTLSPRAVLEHATIAELAARLGTPPQATPR